MDKKILIVLIIIAVLLSGFLLWFFVTNGLFATASDDLVEDLEKGIVRSKVGETVSILDLEFTPVRVVEDSRCPVDAVCVQNGTVRVELLVESVDDEETKIANLNDELIILNDKQIKLLRVEPEISTKQKSLSISDYEFVWQIKEINQ